MSIGALAAPPHALRDAANGRLAFRVWRIFSSRAHGGRYVAINGVRRVDWT